MISEKFVSKLNPSVLKHAQSELGESEERQTQVIQIIRQWVAQQPHLHLVQLENYEIIAFARGCKYSLEKMKRKLELNFTLRSALPEFFSCRDPMKPEIQAALQSGTFLPLLDYDQIGRKVIILRPGCQDPYLHSSEDIEKANFMVSDIMGWKCEQMFVTGIVIIIDLEGYTLNHFTQRPLSLTKKHMYYLQNAAPVSPKSLNFVHMNTTFQTVFNVTMKMLNEKMKKRVKLHTNVESLYKEVNREILPNDYEGDGTSLSSLTEYWKRRVEEKRETLIESDKRIQVDESKRLGKANTAQELFGIEGSFRKLNVD